MPSSMSVATIDKKIEKIDRELGRIDTRIERSRATILAAEALREEFIDDRSHLERLRSRKLASAPTAAADGETPVLNTDLDEAGHAEVAEVVEVVAVEENSSIGRIDDPRLTSASV